MKKIFKKFIATCISLVMVMSFTTVVNAQSYVNEEEAALMSEVLSYWYNNTEGHYNDHNGWTIDAVNSSIDIEHNLDELKATNPELGDAFDKIMSTWLIADTIMPINMDVLPDGLPNDNSLCIITLGFQLNQETGEMQQELIDRLKVTLASANKYPNATIAVTGGGTSPADPTKTEGGLMAEWLIANGVDESRIIVEDKAGTTVENAINTFAYLKAMPNIKNVAIISSDSHVQRGVGIFEAVFELEAYKAKTDSLRIISNAACKNTTRKESMVNQMSSIKQAMERVLNTRLTCNLKNPLSTLDKITIEGLKNEYLLNEKIEYDIIGTFTDHNGKTYEMNINDLVEVNEVNTSKLGKYNLVVKAKYGSKNLELSQQFNVVEKTTATSNPETKPNEKKEAVKTGDDVLLESLAMMMVLSAGGYLALKRS